MSFSYLAFLLIGIIGMGLIDWRHKLALFVDTRRTLTVLVLAVGLFTLWDIAGIALGIFKHGHSAFALGIELLPEFPIEELLFLVLLCYSALVCYRLASERMQP